MTEPTSEQIAKIFTGEITNWSELGGNDAEIAVFGRDSASGTRSAFEEILGIEDKCAYLNEYSTTGDVIGNVASNPNAIGYASLSAVNETVAVSGRRCGSQRGHRCGRQLPIQRPFVIVTVEDWSSPPRPRPSSTTLRAPRSQRSSPPPAPSPPTPKTGPLRTAKAPHNTGGLLPCNRGASDRRSTGPEPRQIHPWKE